MPGLVERVRRLLPAAALVRPVFILGCGRSGTTMLGSVFAEHPDVCYLYEPRHLWVNEPRTDIWSAEARARGGRLELTGADVEPAAAGRVVRAFAREVQRAGKRRLVEKLPINAFRVGYLDALFPDALFVHLLRNGIDVAHSIAARSARGEWDGHGNYKSELLARHAAARGVVTRREWWDDPLARGMLEWRLSLTAAREGLARLPSARWMEIGYERLLADPRAGCRTLEAFTDLAPSDAMHRFALTEVGRTGSAGRAKAYTPAMREIGGALMAELGYEGGPR
jgi:hypothetical protein